jgi:uncharacterized membrane protein YfcA
MIAEFPDLWVTLGILAVVMTAGTIKGSLGIGFPAVAMSIFPIFIEPALGVTLMAIPIFVTNGYQFLSVRGWPTIVRQYWIAGLSVAVTIFLVVQFVADVPSRWINVLVGVSLSVFALASLLKLELKVSPHPLWQLAVGISSGVMGGVSAVKAPIMIYTVALKLPREQFICLAGFLFSAGGVGLVGGTFTATLLNGPTFILSVAATAVALIGFRTGAKIRHRLSDKVFRLALLWIILALGLRLIVVNLI